MYHTIFGKELDEKFMQEALKQAIIAQDNDEVPVGAVVVNDQGVIVARGYNCVEHDCTQRSHAESLAIERAGKANKDWRLNGHWLYVTLEPCSMCMGLIKLSRLSGVVFAAPSPLFGFRLDKADDISVYKRDAFSLVEGICADEAGFLLKKFFSKKRMKDERKT